LECQSPPIFFLPLRKKPLPSKSITRVAGRKRRRKNKEVREGIPFAESVDLDLMVCASSRTIRWKVRLKSPVFVSIVVCPFVEVVEVVNVAVVSIMVNPSPYLVALNFGLNCNQST